MALPIPRVPPVTKQVFARQVKRVGSSYLFRLHIWIGLPVGLQDLVLKVRGKLFVGGKHKNNSAEQTFFPPTSAKQSAVA